MYCCNTAVPPDPVNEITVINTTSSAITFALEFGFNGNGLLTEISISFYATLNREFFQFDTVTFPESGVGPVPSNVEVTGLQPFTSYGFEVEVSNEAGSSQSTRTSVTTLPLRECYRTW